MKEGKSKKVCADPLITRLQERIRKIKRDPGMERQYMLFEELLCDEREEGRREGHAAGLTEGHAAGFTEGREDGQMRLLKLFKAMQEDGIAAEIARLEMDREFREAMYERYGIE